VSAVPAIGADDLLLEPVAGDPYSVLHRAPLLHYDPSQVAPVVPIAGGQGVQPTPSLGPFDPALYDQAAIAARNHAGARANLYGGLSSLGDILDPASLGQTAEAYGASPQAGRAIADVGSLPILPGGAEEAAATDLPTLGRALAGDESGALRLRRPSAYTQDVPEAAPPPMGHNQPPEALAPAPMAPAKPSKPVPLVRQDEPFGDDNPIGTHPAEEALTVNDILHPDTPALPPRSRNVEDIAADLHDRGQQALKDLGVRSGRITGPDDVTDELLARSIASEAQAALERPGANASDWYTGKVNEAMDVAGQMYPQVAEDPNHKMAFRAALAITSQGETVPSNTRLATDAYEYFAQNGRFPTDRVAKQGPAINGNFQKLNDLIDASGGNLDDVREFLDAPTTPRQLKADGFNVGTSESLDTPVYGSHILGAKIGNGFYQNLGGNFDPVTFDLWWQRQWNRKTGNLVGAVDWTPQRQRFEDALNDANQGVPRTVPGLLNAADAITAQHESDFRNYRSEFDSGARTKSELTNAAQRWQQAVNGINQSPTSGGQRQWMRNTVYRARDLLGQQGYAVTPADLQAIMWYPEKDLYAKLGGTPSGGYNVDYATALRARAAQKGIPLRDPQPPLLSASGGPRSAAAADVSGAVPAGGAQRDGADAGAALEPAGLESVPGDPYGGS
jgi:hypothetical protein